MDRRSLLQGLLALPASLVLKEYAFPSQSNAPAGILNVVFDGGFAVVLQADRNFEARVFTPLDPSKKHTLHFLGKGVDAEFDCLNDNKSGNQKHNFTLLPDGLKVNRKVDAKPPEIDPNLCDFNVSTDRWCQENYWATIDLPRPDRILQIGPSRPVRFANNGTRGCIASTYSFQYRIVDGEKVTMLQSGSRPFAPIACDQLMKRYQEGCSQLSEERSKSAGSAEPEMPGVCSEFKGQNPTFCRSGDLTFFFGVGLPAGSTDSEHAVVFFNRELLRSFPDLRGRLEIDWLGRPGECKSDSCHAMPRRIEGSLQETQGKARLIEVSSVVDCHVIGPIVDFPR